MYRVSKPAGRGPEWTSELAPVEERQAVRRTPPVQILLRRLWQGCYGVSAGAFVAIPAALLGEHPPTIKMVIAMSGVFLFSGAAGVLLEVFERRFFPGGEDGG